MLGLRMRTIYNTIGEIIEITYNENFNKYNIILKDNENRIDKHLMSEKEIMKNIKEVKGA